jgi:hypothetical protein
MRTDSDGRGGKCPPFACTRPHVRRRVFSFVNTASPADPSPLNSNAPEEWRTGTQLIEVQFDAAIQLLTALVNTLGVKVIRPVDQRHARLA